MAEIGKLQSSERLLAAEKALGEREEIFKLLVSAVRDYAIFALDPKGYILTWNVGAERLKGYPADEMVGSHFSRFYTPEDIARNHPEDELNIAAREGVYEEEGWRVKKDGSHFWANVVITALRDAQGTLRGFAKVTRDLTERKLADERLRQSEEQLRRLNESLEIKVAERTTQLTELNRLLAESELRYRMLTEMVPQLVWTDLPNGECDYLSSQWIDYTGTPFEKQKGFQWVDLVIHPDDKARVLEHWMGAVKGLHPYDIEYRIRRHDGIYRWFKTRGTPTRNEAGEITYWIGTCTDIEDQKHVEWKLRESEAKFIQLAESLTDQVVHIMDLNPQRITYVSPSYEKIWKKSVSSLYEDPHSFIERIHPEDREKLYHALSLQDSGRESTVEYRLLFEDGSIRWIKDRSFPIRNPAGVTFRATGIAEDITAQRAAEEERAQLLMLSGMDLEALKEEREVRERFVSTLSHDLRSPLTAVKSSAQLLSRYADKPEARERATARIIANVDRADQMIQDLLDANRLRAGQNIPIQILPCEMRSLLVITLEELQLIHGNRFVLRSDQEVHGYWHGEGIRRVVENLCNNAIKYGAPLRLITVSLKTNDQAVEISVHNEGNPLSPFEQEHIFNPFQRLVSAERGSQPGWGLGLTLVQGITKAHGGKVRVESNPEQGTTFTIEMPIDARSAGEQKASADAIPTQNSR